jgi:hypothetical protein
MSEASFVYSYVYLSRATDAFDENHLKEIVEISQRNNRRDNVTGMLLYKDGRFLQILEGSEERVKEIAKRIEGDSRHEELTVIYDGTMPQLFTDWSMGFANLNAEMFNNHPAVLDFFKKTWCAESFQSAQTRVRRLLLNMRYSTGSELRPSERRRYAQPFGQTA